MQTKEEKRKEAELRQKEYDSLTEAQKLNRLNEGGYIAKKERKKRGFPPLQK